MARGLQGGQNVSQGTSVTARGAFDGRGAFGGAAGTASIESEPSSATGGPSSGVSAPVPGASSSTGGSDSAPASVGRDSLRSRCSLIYRWRSNCSSVTATRSRKSTSKVALIASRSVSARRARCSAVKSLTSYSVRPLS